MATFGDTSAGADDYDTDTISLTSTVPEESGEYPVEDVLAEAIMEDGQWYYLIKWKGYGLHECTWEPFEHAEPILPDSWEEKKKKLTNDQLEKYMADNESRVDDARIAAEHAKALRKEKRARRRQKLHRQSIAEAGGAGSESDDDVPLIDRRISTLSSKNSREQSGDSLFVRDVREPQKARVVQSSSSSSDDSEDSIIEELRAKRAKQKERTQPTTSSRVEVATGKSGPNPSVPPKDVEEEKRKSSISQPTQRQERSVKPPPSRSNVAAAREREKQKVVIEGQATTAQEQTGKISINTAVGLKSIGPLANSPASSNNRSPIAPPTVPPRTAFFIRRTTSGSTNAPTGPIRMVNKMPTEQRRQWQNSDRQYNTVSMRRNAELRSRNEHVPDISALQFVNGAPTGFPVQPAPAQESTSSTSNNNVYGRRESVRRRDRNEILEENSDKPPDAPDISKPPLTCWEWRNGTCRYTSERCQFRHENGYKVSPTDGIMPPKYRPKPITCYYFMEGVNGCSKPASECSYAHYNTGLLAIQEHGRRYHTIPIDKSRVPKFEEAPMKHHEQADLLPRRSKKELTCYFWHKNGGCFKGETCAFAHAYTGEIANPPGWIAQQRQGTTNASLDSAPRIIETSSGVTPIAPIATPTQRFAPNSNNRQAAPPTKELRKSPKQTVSHISNVDFETSAARINNDNNDHRSVHAQPFTTSEKLLEVQAPARILCDKLKNIIEDACKIDFQTMFSCFGGREDALDRRAFLFFHPEYHAEELELITRWLLIHHVEVGSLWVSGSWDYFQQKIREGGSGVIITHPEFHKFWQVPGFGDVLRSYVRLWSVGYQLPVESDLQTSVVMLPPRQDCIEIFPRGGIIYITDEVFEQKPVEAFRLVAAFVRQVDICRTVTGPVDPWKRVNDGCLLWRLAVRPELMQTTYNWCIRHEAEVEAKDPAAQSRVQLYNLLSDCNYVEHDQDASEPYIRRPDDYWPIISERKIVSDAYYEALESSQAQANDEQISLYAGTVVELRHMYRQYFIVHTEPSKVNWKSRWLHLDEVLTPEKCIEYLEQPSAKGNRIDFQSWRFPAKSTQPTAAASSETPGMKDMSVDRSDGAGSPMVISESDLRPSPQILH